MLNLLYFLSFLSDWQSGGRRFDPVQLHQEYQALSILLGAFFLDSTSNCEVKCEVELKLLSLTLTFDYPWNVKDTWSNVYSARVITSLFFPKLKENVFWIIIIIFVVFCIDQSFFLPKASLLVIFKYVLYVYINQSIRTIDQHHYLFTFSQPNYFLFNIPSVPPDSYRCIPSDSSRCTNLYKMRWYTYIHLYFPML